MAQFTELLDRSYVKNAEDLMDAKVYILYHITVF